MSDHASQAQSEFDVQRVGSKGCDTSRTEVLDTETERYSLLSSTPNPKTARDVQADNQELEEQLVQDLDTTDVFRMR